MEYNVGDKVLFENEVYIVEKKMRHSKGYAYVIGNDDTIVAEVSNKELKPIAQQ